jgi:hypothetical protein
MGRKLIRHSRRIVAIFCIFAGLDASISAVALRTTPALAYSAPTAASPVRNITPTWGQTETFNGQQEL